MHDYLGETAEAERCWRHVLTLAGGEPERVADYDPSFEAGRCGEHWPRWRSGAAISGGGAAVGGDPGGESRRSRSSGAARCLEIRTRCQPIRAGEHGTTGTIRDEMGHAGDRNEPGPKGWQRRPRGRNA